jgi:hypothetical protein
VVRARFSSVALPFAEVDPSVLNPDEPTLNRFPLVFPMDDAELRVTVASNGVRGELGGSAALADLTEEIVVEPDLVAFRDLVLPMFADLGCDPILLEDCDRISMGYSVDGVPAILVP